MPLAGKTHDEVLKELTTGEIGEARVKAIQTLAKRKGMSFEDARKCELRRAREVQRRYRGCHPAEARQHYKTAYNHRKDAARAYGRAWYAENRDAALSKARLRWAVHRVRRFEQRYGMEAGEYISRLDSLGYCCQICGEPFTVAPKADVPYGYVVTEANIDHDHKTGKVRGILCTDCNQGLGRFKDDPNTMHAAVQYMEDNR